MSTLTTQLKETATWKTISQGQCAFRSSNAQTGTLRCKHLFTNTSECHFVGCPIVQSNYVAVQRDFDTIYLVTKTANARLTETWSDQELPADKDEATKVVTEATSKLNPVLKEAVLTKFNHLVDVSVAIRSAEETGEAGEDEDDLDMSDDELEE